MDDIESIEIGDAMSDVRFGPIPDVNADRMQTLVDCHLARATARGHEAPEMPYCPLIPAGVKATVAGTPEGGVVITLSVADSTSAAEVQRRLTALRERLGESDGDTAKQDER